MALGKRSHLFAGSDSGGERAASMYTLIGSCKLNGLDPEAYLRRVFERIADLHLTDRRYGTGRGWARSLGSPLGATVARMRAGERFVGAHRPACRR